MKTTNAKDYAKAYKKQGLQPIPVDTKSKRPSISNWTEANYSEEEIDRVFSDNSNIGVVLGKPSNNLIDIDIDCPEGYLISKELLPSTKLVFGRKSNPSSHYLYFCEIETSKFQDPIAKLHGNKSTLVEIRSTGAQTVFPGSTHETGEEIKWEWDIEAPTLSSDELYSHVATFSAACLLARYWPEGARNDATLSLTGALLHSGWEPARVTQFVKAVLTASGDDELDSRQSAIQSTITKFHSNINVTGWPSFADFYDDKVIAKVREWLDIHHSNYESDFAEFDSNFDNNVDLELLFNPEEARIDYYLDNDAPPPKVLFHGFPIPFNKSCTQIATGGTGKSFFCLQMGVALASNTALCDKWKPAMPGKVLVLCAEDDTDEIHRRIESITKYVAHKIGHSKDALDILGYTLSHDEFYSRLRENLFVKSLIGKDNLLTKDRNGEIARTPTLTKLIRTAKEINDLKLIVVDPISRFRGGEENSAEDVTRFVEALELIVKETGATVLASHHSNKDSQKSGASADQFAARGSSALTDGVRWQMNMATMDSYQAKNLSIKKDEMKNFVHVAIPKSNYSKPFTGKWLIRRDGGVLEYTVISSKSDLEKENLLPKLIEKIEFRLDLGYEHSISDFIGLFSGKDNEFGLSRDKLKNLINLGIDTKVIGVREPINPKRNVKEVLYVIEQKLDLNELEDLSTCEPGLLGVLERPDSCLADEEQKHNSDCS
jgi:hypothetical protein